MVVADLHVHTTNSDGTLTLPEIPALARDAGLDAVAVTDHDRLHPDLGHPVAERDGVTLIHGIELRVEAGDQQVDLLGYGARATDALVDEVDRLQRDRRARGRAIIECVEDRLGISLPVEPERGLGRPDIARAVVASDADYDEIGAVFDDLIDESAPCYRARDIPGFERGRELLAETCGLVSLAHPLRYPDPGAALDSAAALDAVELHYPYDGSRGHDPGSGPLKPADVRRFADRHDLLVTGGSDAHGRDIGGTGLDHADFDPVADALGL